MEKEIKQEFEKVWEKIRKLERSIWSGKKKIVKPKKDGKNIFKIISKSQIKLGDYPTDKFKKAMDKCLFALKLAKDVGIEEGLLTVDMKAILKRKLRATNLPSMTAISNAMKKAEKKSFVVSFLFESGEKRQRRYRIHEDGEKYVKNLSNKNGKSE